MSYPVSIQVLTALYYPNISYNTFYWQSLTLDKDQNGSFVICGPNTEIFQSATTASAIFFFESKLGYLNSTHALMMSSYFPTPDAFSAFPFSTNYRIPPTTATLISNLLL